MTAKNTTFTATATIDGVEYSSTRTSARPYTHAAFHKTGNPKAIEAGKLYYATFHASRALAEKSSSDKANGATYAIVEATVTEKPARKAVAKTETPAAPVTEAPKAPAKRVRKAAKPEVPSAVAEIVAFVLGGVQTAKTEVSKTVLTKAAGQLKAGQIDDARKTLYPIRTRVALKAIHMIKAL
jgi:hypothetical protein